MKNCIFIKGNPPESGQVIRGVEKVEEGGGGLKTGSNAFSQGFILEGGSQTLEAGLHIIIEHVL